MNRSGRRSEFAIEVHDDHSVAVWVAGRNLTAHMGEDEVALSTGRADEVRAWLVDAWPAFFESARWPVPSRAVHARALQDELDEQVQRAPTAAIRAEREAQALAFRRTHRMGGMPEGLDIFLSREGDTVVFAWRAGRPNESPLLNPFLANLGEAAIDAGAFVREVRCFVRASGEPRFRAWEERLAGEGGARAVILHQAGLDESQLAPLLAQTGLDFWQFFAVEATAPRDGTISPFASPVAMAFRGASPTLSEADRLSLRSLIAETPPAPRARTLIEALRTRLPMPSADQADYQQGYALATTLRRWLGRPHEPLDIEALLTRTLSIPVVELSLGDEGLDGGCLFGEATGPLVFVNPNALMAGTAWGRRMTLAHELCHLLLDRPPEHTLGHVSGTWSVPRLERRANAFAAELLLPEPAMHRAQREGTGYDTLMNTYGVGLTTATWHVRNRLGRDLASVETRTVPAPSPSQAVPGTMTAAKYQVLFTILARPELLGDEAAIRRLATTSDEAIALGAGAIPADVREVLARLSGRGLLGGGERRLLRSHRLIADWWHVGYADAVRPAQNPWTTPVRLPADPDAALQALKERLPSAGRWWWGGEAAAWLTERHLRPEHLLIHLEKPVPLELQGEGERDWPLTVLRLPCPAARGPGETVHPLLIWSELKLLPDERDHEVADAIWARLFAASGARST